MDRLCRSYGHVYCASLIAASHLCALSLIGTRIHGQGSGDGYCGAWIVMFFHSCIVADTDTGTGTDVKLIASMGSGIVSTDACMYACSYVCMYVCMCMCTCTGTDTGTDTENICAFE